MKRTEDVGWKQMIDAMDFDAAELAQAEQRLDRAEDQRLPEATVERMVVQVTQEPPAVRPVTQWNARRWSKVAAVVIAAALVATAPLWSGQFWTAMFKSTKTMPYAMAIEGLKLKDQPDNALVPALKIVSQQVTHATDALLSLRRNPATASRLTEAAEIGLQEILAVADGLASAQPPFADEDVTEIAAQALDTKGTVPARMRRIDQLRSTAISGVIVLRDITGLRPRPDSERTDFLDKLSLRIRPIAYTDALDLFADPKASVPMRRQALQVLKRRTLSGVRVLQSLASATEDLELAASAGRWLINLRSEREVANGDAPSDSALGQLEALIKLTTLDTSERLEHLDRLAKSAAAGLGALKKVSGLPRDLEAYRTLHLSDLREELAR